MGLPRGRNISKKTTEDLYYLQSLQVQHDVLVSPSLPVPFIKSLFLKEIILLRDVDTGERTAEYLHQKQLDKNIYSDLINIQL